MDMYFLKSDYCQLGDSIAFPNFPGNTLRDWPNFGHIYNLLIGLYKPSNGFDYSMRNSSFDRFISLCH